MLRNTSSRPMLMQRKLWTRPAAWSTGALLALVWVWTGSVWAQTAPPHARVGTSAPDIRLVNSAIHPDRLFAPYFTRRTEDAATDAAKSRLATSFQPLLKIYLNRQVYDDNFSIHVYDMREDAKSLEVFSLTRERAAFEQTGEADWQAIDRLRRKHTTRLVDKYEQMGIPRKHIAAKWGRSNQVHQAHRRELATVLYEIRLARLLGLSLLAGEIGTVETFNVDSLVSSAGARGRYQMLPYTLRQSDIHRYTLDTSYGRKVSVKEELHPLLTMEPAFIWMRAQANAVGHEIPGLSAYHAGPGTIFRLFSMFLQHGEQFHGPETTVLDAYVWALTEGFDTVKRSTRFRSASRGYIPAVYASLRSIEHFSIDTTRTLQAELVQLKPDRSIFLGELLAALQGSTLQWPAGTSSSSLYERFRILNPHIALVRPSAADGVPARGNVRLRRTSGSHPVRFFLPLRAVSTLKAKGLDIIDEEVSFRFDETTFQRPSEAEITHWDNAYQKVLEETVTFGFNLTSLDKLRAIKAEFERLAEEMPTRFRKRQRAIIHHHERLWNFSGWRDMAELAAAMKARNQLRSSE